MEAGIQPYQTVQQSGTQATGSINLGLQGELLKLDYRWQKQPLKLS